MDAEQIDAGQYTDERDEHGRLLADREVWRQATTLPAAGELTARWLEGASQYQPGTLTARIDAETAPIAVELARVNRSGFFTKESQPGVDVAGLKQRQYLTGYADPETAVHLLRLSAASDIVAMVHAPGEPSQVSVPVTVQGGDVVTVLGVNESPIEEAELRDWAAESNDSLALLLASSWFVELFDPVWGREDHLLPAVLAALVDPLHGPLNSVAGPVQPDQQYP